MAITEIGWVALCHTTALPPELVESIEYYVSTSGIRTGSNDDLSMFDLEDLFERHAPGQKIEILRRFWGEEVTWRDLTPEETAAKGAEEAATRVRAAEYAARRELESAHPPCPIHGVPMDYLYGSYVHNVSKLDRYGWNHYKCWGK